MLRIVSLALAVQACSAGTETVSGYLVDALCWSNPGHLSVFGVNTETNPASHSIECLLMQPCIDSGCGLVTPRTRPEYTR